LPRIALQLGFRGMNKLIANLKTFVPELHGSIMLPSSGHWTQREHPHAAILVFLKGQGWSGNSHAFGWRFVLVGSARPGAVERGRRAGHGAFLPYPDQPGMTAQSPRRGL
jgi:hypothetical protein